jgi:hypothetical protein
MVVCPSDEGNSLQNYLIEISHRRFESYYHLKNGELAESIIAVVLKITDHLNGGPLVGIQYSPQKIWLSDEIGST